MPANVDSVEFTVMTYRTYIGDDLNGYNYEQWGAPQTYMMLDIAALQHMYGADFTTNSGNTVYSWNPATAIRWSTASRRSQPGGNRIFATIWDGGGTDTYDLSAYSDEPEHRPHSRRRLHLLLGAARQPRRRPERRARPRQHLQRAAIPGGRPLADRERDRRLGNDMHHRQPGEQHAYRQRRRRHADRQRRQRHARWRRRRRHHQSAATATTRSSTATAVEFDDHRAAPAPTRSTTRDRRWTAPRSISQPAWFPSPAAAARPSPASRTSAARKATTPSSAAPLRTSSTARAATTGLWRRRQRHRRHRGRRRRYRPRRGRQRHRSGAAPAWTSMIGGAGNDRFDFDLISDSVAGANCDILQAGGGGNAFDLPGANNPRPRATGSTSPRSTRTSTWGATRTSSSAALASGTSAVSTQGT